MEPLNSTNSAGSATRTNPDGPYLPVELQGLVLAVQPHPLSAHLAVLHTHAALLPRAEAQHPETERPPLRGLDERRGHLVLPDRDAVHLHDVVPGPQARAAGWGARGAVLHQQRAVSHDGEPKTTIWAWHDVHLHKTQV